MLNFLTKSLVSSLSLTIPKYGNLISSEFTLRSSRVFCRQTFAHLSRRIEPFRAWKCPRSEENVSVAVSLSSTNCLFTYGKTFHRLIVADLFSSSWQKVFTRTNIIRQGHNQEEIFINRLEFQEKRNDFPFLGTFVFFSTAKWIDWIDSETNKNHFRFCPDVSKSKRMLIYFHSIKTFQANPNGEFSVVRWRRRWALTSDFQVDSTRPVGDEFSDRPDRRTVRTADFKCYCPAEEEYFLVNLTEYNQLISDINASFTRLIQLFLDLLFEPTG